MPTLLCRSFRGIIVGFAVLALVPAVLFAQEPLYTNSFEGAKDGTHPLGWTFVGAEGPEFWVIAHGALSTGNGDDYRYGDCYAILSDPKALDWTDYFIQSDFWSSQTRGQILLVVRWQNRDNYYLAVLSTGATGADPNYAQIVKVESGQRYVLGEATDGKDGASVPSFRGDTPADSHRLRFQVVGTKLSFAMDGKVLVSADDGTFAKGACGLGQREDLVYFDNVLVMPAKAGEPAVAAASGPAPSAQPAQAAAPVSPLSAAGTPPVANAYRLVIMDGLARAAADRLRGEMVKQFPSSAIDVVQQPDGKYEILYGFYMSRQEATNSMNQLIRDEGLNIKDVVQVSGQQALQSFREAADTAGPNTRYRVVAQEFPDPGTARQMKSSLESSGYFPVTVVPVSGRYRVLCGPPFASRSEAQKLADDMKSSGFFAATIAQVSVGGAFGGVPGAVAAAPLPPLVTSQQLQTVSKSIGYQPTQKELNQVASILKEKQQAERTGNITAVEYTDLVNRIKNLSEGQKQLVQRFDQTEQERQAKERKAMEFKSAVESAQDSKNWKQALSLLKQWEELDPTNPAIELKRRVIESLQKGGSEVQNAIAKVDQTRLSKTVEEAKQAESQGDLEQALVFWRSVRADPSVSSALYSQASDAITRLSAKQDEIRAKQEAAAKRQNTMMYLVIGVIVALVALVAVIMIVMMARSRKRDQELLRQVQELTVRPLKELDQRAKPKLIEGDEKPGATAPPPKEEKKAPSKPAAPPVPVSEPGPAASPAHAPVVAETPPGLWDDTRIVSPQEEAPPPASAPSPYSAPPSFEPPPPATPEPIVLEEEPSGPELPVGAGVSDGPHAGPEAPGPPVEKVSPVGGVPEAHSFLDIPSQDDLTAILTGALGPGKDFQGETTEPKTAEPPPEPAPVAAKEAEEPVAMASPPEAQVPPLAPPPAPPPPAAAAPPPLAPAGAAEAPAPPAPAPPAPAPPAPAPQVPQPAPSLASAPPLPPVAPAPAPAPAPAAAPAATDGNLVYSQDFDDEQDGVMPRNWAGDYDYSSLVVSSQTPAPNSKHCLRFEKRQGSGSAYYSCRFPDVGGRLVVEFDLRCDDKNKYLLGFYIEKDEDFRQSVHTIIHRTSPQVAPTLRIQGEPTQYSLGTWRHMKYEIDLNSNSVNGYVDGEPVAENVKLASPPRSINTLSIRDNLATTGVLLVDNIRIMKL